MFLRLYIQKTALLQRPLTDIASDFNTSLERAFSSRSVGGGLPDAPQLVRIIVSRAKPESRVRKILSFNL